MSAYSQIGTIVATKGWNGELVITHPPGSKMSLKKTSALFIEENKNNFIPYFIESIHQNKETEAVLKLEGINSMERARTLLKKKIYIEQQRFHNVIQPDSPLYYTGFTICEKEKKLGEIDEIIEMPGQLIARLFEKEAELLIPLTEQTIVKIDRKRKIIHVSLPDGLLDVYREKNASGE